MNYRSKQYISIAFSESSCMGLNLESTTARISIKTSPSIEQVASYLNIVMIRWRRMNVLYHVGMSCFAGSLEVWEKTL